MKTPIDYSSLTLPIKPKYLDQETPEFARWFIFGENPDNGTVDIASPDGDVMTAVPRRKAERIMDARSRFVDEVISVLNET